MHIYLEVTFKLPILAPFFIRLSKFPSFMNMRIWKGIRKSVRISARQIHVICTFLRCRSIIDAVFVEHKWYIKCLGIHAFNALKNVVKLSIQHSVWRRSRKSWWQKTYPFKFHHICMKTRQLADYRDKVCVSFYSRGSYADCETHEVNKPSYASTSDWGSGQIICTVRHLCRRVFI